MEQVVSGRGEAWNPEIQENRVFMLLPVVFDSKSKLDRSASKKLKNFIEQVKGIPAANFPGQVAEKFPKMGNTKALRLWTDLAGDATEDFHPFVRQTASISKESHTNDFPFAYPLQLQQEDMISQLKGGKPRRFRLKLGDAASKRCGRNSIFLQFFAPSLYSFASGTAVLVLEWCYLSDGNGPVLAADVIEGNFAISHTVRSKPKATTTTEFEGGEPALESDDFVALAAAMLPPDLVNSTPAGRRIFYTALRLAPHDAPTAKANIALLAHRLAHRQTYDYQPNPELVAAGQLRPFSNVSHAATIEGGCTLIEADNTAPESLKGLIKDRVRNTYLPLALVSYHAYFWLLNQTQVLPDSSAAKSSHHEKEDLENLRERVLNFRRLFHFPVASQISQHNDFHAMWQRALLIDRQLDVLAELSESAASMVHEKRVRLFGYLSGGVGGLLLGKELFEVIRDKAVTNVYEWQRMLLESHMKPDDALLMRINEAVRQSEFWEWIPILGAGMGLVLGLLVAWRFGLHGGHR